MNIFQIQGELSKKIIELYFSNTYNTQLYIFHRAASKESIENHTSLLSQLIEAVNNTNCFGGQVHSFAYTLWSIRLLEYVLKQQSGVE